MKKIIGNLLLGFFVAGCVHPAQQTREVDSAQIMKSPNDKRQYEYLELPNQMRVLLVSDPDADKAAAALTVGVGSISNPPGRDGLAHFLEHMLFMGTEKYPDVDDYSSFMKRNGGSDNAFTDDNQTSFFFDIKAEKLEPAMDRFAQFFIAPLFKAEYVDREKHAVHSEYQLKLKDDFRRSDAAEKHSYNPHSPYARFAVGNLDTLADLPGHKVRDDLLTFYNKYYSANIMGLTVVGREPLPVLRKWAQEKFSAVPNHNASPYRPKPTELIYRPEQLPIKVAVVPLKKLHKLTLNFPLPSVRKDYRTRPLSYISQFVGDEGKGSLHSLLKAKGWITSLSSGGYSLDDVQGFMSVSMELTKEGMQHVAEITEAFFEYVALLKSDGIADWRFDEQRRKSELDFRFQEKMPSNFYALTLSGKLLQYPPKDLLRADKVMEKFDAKLLRDLLDYIRPDNMAMVLVDPDLKSDQVEQYYQVPYAIEKISATQLKQWQQTNNTYAALKLPTPNPFLPEKVALKPVADKHPVPLRLEEQQGLSLWWQQDESFGTPKAVIAASLKIPEARDTAARAVKLSLLVDLVKDELNEYSYPAKLAGLGYIIRERTDGLTLIIYGYDEKQPLLLEKVLSVLKRPALAADRFKLYKAKLQRNLANKALDRPFRQVLAEMKRQLVKPAWRPAEKLQALHQISRQDLVEYTGKLFNNMEVEVLADGNLTADEAKSIKTVLRQHFLQDVSLIEAPETPVTVLAPGQTRTQQYAVDHPDAVTVMYYQGNQKSIDEQARWRMLGQVLSSPFFTSLRTEQQLGYVVGAAFSESKNMPGLLFVVQSSAVSAPELQKRMNTFIQEYAGQLKTMDEKEFQNHKAGLISKLLKKDDRLGTRVSRYMDDLEWKQYSFDFKKRIAEEVKGLTQQQLLAFYRQNFLERPRRLVVYSSGSRFAQGADK